MLDSRKLEEIRKRMTNFINEGIVRKTKEVRFVDHYLENAKKSIHSAKLLYLVSTEKDLQQTIGFPNFDGNLWVINASYYSMFYVARALLESQGIQFRKENSIHSLIFDALVYFFLLTGKIKKNIIEYYSEAKEESAELIGEEKSTELVKSYMYEKNKRTDYTYTAGVQPIWSKSKTSLDRAEMFFGEIRKLFFNH